MSLWGKLLDLLFPPRCAFCGALLDGEDGVCPACEAALRGLEGPGLRALDFGPCAAAFYYEGMVRPEVPGPAAERGGVCPVYGPGGGGAAGRGL